MSAAVSQAPPQRHARILACVLCQHRKIKCDRNSPCSNCIKANVTCVPSTPAPARKRRRPNQDLQERLARCEELLKQYADGSAPSQKLSRQQTGTPAMTDPKRPVESESQPVGPENSSNWKPACRMVNDDGSVRFMDSYIWATVYEELQAMRDIIDTEDPEDSSILGSEELTPENNTDLFFPGDLSTASIDDLVPDPIHAFKLWQLFLERVNPLFKVVHVPTVQPMVMEGATNIASLSYCQQALVLSIYTTAALSLSDAESIQLLGMSRESAIQKFLAGTKVALIRFNFLKNYNMTALQALVHFMHCLQGRYDRHAAWVLTGAIVRIAQKMGYHRDGEILGLEPYETEMRRRLWWQIIIQDAKYAMLSGLSQSLLPVHWDTMTPQNVNDADLFPGSTEKIRPRDGPTEMAFVMVLNEIYKFKIQTDSNNSGPAFEAAILGQDLSPDKDASNAMHQHIFAKFRQHCQELDEKLGVMEQKYIDVNADNVHRAAKSIRQMLMGKVQDMMVPIHEQPEYGTEIFGPKDNLFKIFVLGTEQRLEQYQPMAECGFLWFVKSYFQLDVFAVMTGQLCQRPTGSLADRGWAGIERLYGYHTELFDMSQKQYSVQAQITLKGWRLREQAFMQAGRRLETPQFIQRLRDLLPSYDSRSSIQSSGATPPILGQSEAQRQSAPLFQNTQNPKMPQPNVVQQQQPGTNLDPFLGGLLDMSSVNWDMFGDMMNPHEQLSVGMFGYGGFPGATDGSSIVGNSSNVNMGEFG
ncbi:fungal specific transcription factor domain-containing protein [Metarhizium album ARSEF 1941]|uniref:Fungal specific transcription factor domain-containing protein n=1 Tax=Metarhizium album (strain ARSEF 1941) TaxID=1081103 RepID=A0A0B2WMJ8_METAS|nr:fungal specific transcription factor domain-containing protein [Metarhizium album ARSEF 1941]KHN94919.1 fungal specific transcription factor domain-containing protein [Metarhizium album ARSEF 1941]